MWLCGWVCLQKKEGGWGFFRYWMTVTLDWLRLMVLLLAVWPVTCPGLAPPRLAWKKSTPVATTPTADPTQLGAQDGFCVY